jgi:hypothetical protein
MKSGFAFSQQLLQQFTIAAPATYLSNAIGFRMQQGIHISPGGD